MKNGKNLLVWAVGVVALGVTVYYVSVAWKKGQEGKINPFKK
jgi:hypothetical protein